MKGRPVPLVVALLVCALLVGSATLMTFQSLALSADGSYYLLRVLGDETVFGPDARFLANVVRQAPVLAAARLGLRNTELLTLAHGAGQLLVPALSWSAAVLLARGDRLVFATVSMTAGVCAASTWLFNVSESVLAAPLTVLVGVLLWRPRWQMHHVALAASASAVLLASYETAVVSGALLGVWGVWRALAADTRPDRYGSAVVSVAAFASVLVGFVGLQDQSESPSGQAFLYVLVSLEPWALYVALIGVAMIVGGSFLTTTARRVSLVAGALLVVTSALVYEGTATAAYEARAGATLASVLLLLFLWWRWRVRGSAAVGSGSSDSILPILAVAVVAILVAPALRESAEWADSLNAFRAALARTEGVTFADEALPDDRQDVLFDWTSSSLSLIVRHRPSAAVLVDRGPSLVPFPPATAREQLSDDYVWR